MPLLSPTRILRATATSKSSIKWSDTLNLPKSAFPARASAAELQTYRQRCADDLYAWQQRARKGPEHDDFVLHDGPPYANGAVHVGHALNKILKDLILRWELAKGKRVAYRPGWDCHGLPIELKALQQRQVKDAHSATLRDAPKKEAMVAPATGMSASEIRATARQLAEQTIERQKGSFRGWGVIGEWDDPYKTLDKGFEVRQLGVFREMVRKGLISRRHRPVHWSPSSRTALAEAELEYDDAHQCTAAYVKMPFLQVPKHLQDLPINWTRFSALIWTTTPWTLPANRAIALGSEINYSVIRLSSAANDSAQQEWVLVAKSRAEHVVSYLPEGWDYHIEVDNIRGSELIESTLSQVPYPTNGSGDDVANIRPWSSCYNFWQGTVSPLILADFVTDSSGTGVVHIAPSHGMDDYRVCAQHDDQRSVRNMYEIGPPVSFVDDAGRFTADVLQLGSMNSCAANLRGLDAQSEGAKSILELLKSPSNYVAGLPGTSIRSHLYASHHFTHKNPIDWRTKQPVIVRATAQWFADVSAIQNRACSSLDSVEFIPKAGKARLSSFLSGRSSWCISRQRAWGVPIPTLYHKDTGDHCITDKSIAHIIEVIKQRGTDAWFSDPEDDPAWLHSSLEPETWIRGKDTMDVWFDSGTTWTTLENQERKPLSDVYVEGTDQHRGWFQSSLLTHVAVQDSSMTPSAPYRTLITHGFILDAEGRKMSKSLGNVIAPEQIVDGSLLPPIKVKKQKGTGKGKAVKLATDDAKGPQYDSMGPDVLRLWVASSDYTRDVSVSIQQLQEVQQTLQKYRVTFKWLLGVLGDYAPNTLGDKQRPRFVDQAILHRLSQVSKAAHEAYENYEFHRGVKEITAFINQDLSAFYFEIVKDEMYTGSSVMRQRTQSILRTILKEMMRMLGPVVPHLIEETWAFLPAGLKEGSSHPLRQVMTEPYQFSESGAQDLQKAMYNFTRLSAAVKLAQEEARKDGHLKSGLACRICITIPTAVESSGLAQDIRAWHNDSELADLLVVSQVDVSVHDQIRIDASPQWHYMRLIDENHISAGERASIRVEVLPPEGEKCVRCWKMTAEGSEEPCAKCQDVLNEKGISVPRQES